MKKNSKSASKKVVPIKGTQKITSFFNKLENQTSKLTNNINNVNVKQSAINPDFDDDDDFIFIDTVKKTTPVKENMNSLPTSQINKRLQLVTNIKTRNNLKCDLQSAEDCVLFKPEKTTYLERYESLLDVTNKSPNRFYFRPEENLKKRKFEEDFSDIIPSTPEKLLHKTVKFRSKPHVENKFLRIEEQHLKKKNYILPERVNHSVNKSPDKIILSKDYRLLQNKINDNEISEPDENFRISLKYSPLKNELVQSTSSYNVRIIKSPSPTKFSLQKGIRLRKSISPSNSNIKLNPVFESAYNYDCFVKEEMGLISPSKSKRMLFALQRDSVDDLVSSKMLQNKTINQMKEKDIQETNDNLVNMFDDDWDDEIKCIEEKLYQLNLDNWQYCRILEVKIDDTQNLVIKIESIENQKITKCRLQGVWQYLNLQPKDNVNILAMKHSGEIPYCINNDGGYLVYEPDIMVSPTSILGSQFCKRKGILTEKFRGFESENKIMIVGTLVHRLLQDVLKKEMYRNELIEKQLMSILSSRDILYTSYCSQIPIEELKKELMPFVPKILNFIKTYIMNKNKLKSFNSIKDVSQNWRGNIHSILDIEENIWCPQYGLKGKVDITVSTNSFGSILPLELKTGRATMSLEHRGQIILYIMIMSELGYDVFSGLLLYLREDVIREVKANHIEKRDLIMLRNEFVYYIKQEPKVPNSQQCSGSISENILSELDPKKQLKFVKLPDPINHHSACAKCHYVNICTALLSCDDSYILSENNPLKELSVQVLKNLKPNHINYFTHWMSLLALESSYKPPIKNMKDIWRQPPYKRERCGKSICYLKLSARVIEEDLSFIHTFVRETDESIENILTDHKLKNDFFLSGLSVGNYVVISTNFRFAVAMGFITNLTKTSVTVALERNLSERYGLKNFHLDTYESHSIVNFSRTSLAALIEPTEAALRLRELIIDRQPSIISRKCIILEGDSILNKLNEDQKRAVLKALEVENYLLIKGMPGTGKTATIVALIEFLIKLNKTVLLTSHTHSAVDNVCLRLLKSGIEFIRLGSESKINSELRHRSESVLTAHCKTVKEIEEVYDNARVVAVTCLAAGHRMLNKRKLDICIVDESTQVLQCSVIKALLSTNSFVLIGDPEQLPPVIRNPEAAYRGMGESLFNRLDNLGSTITLTLQYRMNKIVTDLANALTYNGQLSCANKNIEIATLIIPKPEKLQYVCRDQPWILNILDSKLENSVVAVDTGPIWNFCEEKHTTEDNLLIQLEVPPQNVQEDEERKCSNSYEAAVIVTLIQTLKVAGVTSDCIGVIAPYRAQVNLLRKHVSKIYEEESCEPVDVNTVDQYQGRDKEIIVYSCTRSKNIVKPNNKGYEILDDKRRLTVAITRSKHKLIIIGDFTTLKEYSPFKKLLNSLQTHQKLKLEKNVQKFDWNQIIKCLE